MDTLRSALEGLSADTWARLKDAKQLDIRFGEETITDLLLLDLRRRQPKRAEFIQTPKSMEAKSGTDFEWWMGSDRTGWLRFAVQAKRLHLASGRYKNLGHKVGTSLQIDLLDAYASANDATALYAFYNYRETLNEANHWHCCRFPIDDAQLGCTVTPLSVVRDTLSKHGTKNFDHIHRDNRTIPWRCIGCCPRVRSWTRAPDAPADDELMASDRFPFDNMPRRWERLPTPLRAARTSGRLEWFDPEYYSMDVPHPKRVLVMESTLEDETLD